MSFILQDDRADLEGAGPRHLARACSRPRTSYDDRWRPDLQWTTLIVVLITLPVLVALLCLVQRTQQGKAMRATAQDRDAAAIMGINVNRTISFTFLIAGGLAGAAGLVYALTSRRGPLRPGLPARADRVHRGRARRHRQPARRRARRAPDRDHPGVQRGAHLARAGHRLDRVDRLLDPDPDPRLPPRGPARRANARRRARP